MEDNKVLPITMGFNDSISGYKELDLFRQHMEKQEMAPHQQPYQAYKGQALFYRLVFAALGTLFLGLIAILYTKSLLWTHSLFFADSQLLKGTLYAFCGSLAGLGFVAAYQIRPEREALHSLRRRAYRLLRKIYQERLISMGVKRFLAQGKHQHELVVVKHRFHDALDRVNDAAAGSSQLLATIAASSLLNGEMRTKLFNQALLELQDKFDLILRSYI